GLNCTQYNSNHVDKTASVVDCCFKPIYLEPTFCTSQVSHYVMAGEWAIEHWKGKSFYTVHVVRVTNSLFPIPLKRIAQLGCACNNQVASIRSTFSPPCTPSLSH